MIRVFDHVVIVKLSAFPGKSFTSCPGIGSGIFSENQDLVEHLSPPLISIPACPVLGFYDTIEMTGCKKLNNHYLSSQYF
jgi:hypothetical protein